MRREWSHPGGGSASALTEDRSFEENGVCVVFLRSTDEKSAATSGVHQHAGILCFRPVLMDHSFLHNSSDALLAMESMKDKKNY